MSISAFDNPSDELIDAIIKRAKDNNKLLRKALKVHHKKYRSDWHNGYAAYLDGYRMDEREINIRINREREYISGYKIAEKECPDAS